MKTPGDKRWIILPCASASESNLVETLHVSALVARILTQRGHDTPEKAGAFLQPLLKNLGDPFALPSLREAAVRIWQAIDRRERIVIYGDYDVDGITSTALLEQVLRVLGAEVRHFLPHRMDEGYGLSADGIARCLGETEPRLLIAVDCGTTAAKEIDGLAQKGIEVIVLDHHQPPAELPRCLLINPKLSPQSSALSPQSPTYHLATVGVVFKLCHGLLKIGRETGKTAAAACDLRQHLDLVAVGTVADVVPLEGENRILVKAGLEQLAKTRHAGLVALKEVSRIPDRIHPHHIGFQLGPRLNAMGRLGDAMTALELLLTEDSARAKELAGLLDRHNRDRQQIEQDTFDQARESLRELDPSQRVIVLAGDGWHLGVIGIVAARLMREFHRPTVVIGIDPDGNGKGSCRSIEGFHIVEGLQRCAQYLERYGGHQAAAGLSIQSKHIDAFRTQLNVVAQEMIAVDALQPSIKACAEIPLSEVTDDLLDDLERLGPYGSGNPTPVFVASGIRLRGKPQIVGQGHLKLWLEDGGETFDAIGFNLGACQPRGGQVDIAFVPQWNEYQGKRTIQLKLVDVRDSGIADRNL